MKKLTVVLTIVTLICGVLFSLTGCNAAEPNARETAKKLEFGKKAGVLLGTNDYYWYFFELDAETKIALEVPKKDISVEVFSDGEFEAITKITDDFWSKNLSVGKYYVKVVCSNGNLFGTIIVNITLHNVQELLNLPIDSEFSLDQQEFNASTKEAYYRLDIDKDSTINIQTYKHPDLLVNLIFYNSGSDQTTKTIIFDYLDDFADLEQNVQLKSGEYVVLIQYIKISANAKKPNITKTANLMITIV